MNLFQESFITVVELGQKNPNKTEYERAKKVGEKYYSEIICKYMLLRKIKFDNFY